MSVPIHIAFFACLLLVAVESRGAEYFVSPGGADADPGTRERPLRRIQRAADMMQAGDVCTIRAGIYREWIRPPRGGVSEDRPITYRAAPGERVIIRGSERIISWARDNGTVWRAELPDSFFGDFNPYRLHLSGDWLHYGKEYHLGCVYQDGVSLREKFTAQEVAAAPGSYRIEENPGSVMLHANFGENDPNREQVEINVRECVFFPRLEGLGYVTLDGLWFEHAAANWAAWRCAQRGAVGTGWGFRWVIRNCRVSDARCVGIVCGNAASSENSGFDLTNVGGHLVQRNHILRCGQAAIHGFKGWGSSVIEGNLIEDINVHEEFGGEETAGIKIHNPIDVTIRNNVLRRIHARRVPGDNNDFAAIWVDWAGQGTRVTGNVVYDNDPETWALYLQNNHGSPILIDHNVFAGTISSSSSGCVFAHNLFDRCRWNFLKPYAWVAYWKPHTAEVADCKVITCGHDRYLNNVFCGDGIERLPEGPGMQADWNVFYGGAKASGWADPHSLVLPEIKPQIEFVSRPDGVDLRFDGGDAPQLVKCPLINRDFIGEFALTGQGLESPDGTPLALDRDFSGRLRDAVHPAAGPFEGTGPTSVSSRRTGP
ncbi:MAG: right-handed parallel beta-helix repeat-containing protein [Akkermansiaceae bacterium]|nr:right-handed parallel beta-helix repeat-containing protein [Akkermansiaceae bacterium]